MESRDLVSISRFVSRPIFASLGLEGYRSRSQSYCLETLKIARIWLSKTFAIQKHFVCCICRQETTITRGGNDRNSKKVQLKSDDDIFWKISAKSTNFEVSSHWIFDEAAGSNFWRGLGHGGYGLDYITGNYVSWSLVCLWAPFPWMGVACRTSLANLSRDILVQLPNHGVGMNGFKTSLKYFLHLPRTSSSLLSKTPFWSFMERTTLDFLPRRRPWFATEYFVGLLVICIWLKPEFSQYCILDFHIVTPADFRPSANRKCKAL